MPKPTAPGGPEEESAGGSGSPSHAFLLQVARGEARAANVDAALPGLDTGRFDVQRRLGEGGFGAVYEVFDRERNATVALKTMTRHDARALARFKQEFRALADLAHPNLVSLYELHGEDGGWFFTMELVAGQHPDTYVEITGGALTTDKPIAEHGLGSESTALAPQDAALAVTGVAANAIERRAEPGSKKFPAAFDETKLRALFVQLTRGLVFLHDSGFLHRDVKPSNVIVTREGRVVILDFGLVVDFTLEGEQTAAGAGTPYYMAPEQVACEPLGPAADFYSVGVMLYQALAGRLPFEGSALQVLQHKLVDEPAPPSHWVDGVPEDLERLSMELLQREPAARPSGRDVLERLMASASDRGAQLPHAQAHGPTAFVGRVAELAKLDEALEIARSGKTAVALVHGRSGMGKSALANRFLDRLRVEHPRVLVLAGRCFEQESVPYKALDSVIDALAHRFLQMSTAEVQAILPRDVATLARLFPALSRVPAIESAPRREQGADDLALRRRAFAALRELFARLGDRRTLVLFIDDLQWGDADGGALLADLLRPPDAPPMLFVASYRTDDAERSDCLRTLLPALRDMALDLREVPIERLGDVDAGALAIATLGAGAADERVSAIVRESAGWPFFIQQLCAFASEHDDAGAMVEPRLSLEAMIAARVQALPDAARRLLDTIAVAGQPIERGVAATAADLGDDEPSAVAELRRRQLLRVRTGRARDEVEAYHDRVREAVFARLETAQKARHHARLATALEATGRADAETLAAHFKGAGDRPKAASWSETAANNAFAALGFERAARLYKQALDCLDEGDARERRLRERLGDALVNTGRNVDAATAYLQAVEGADAARALDLRRRAAEHYLIAGRFDDGLAVLSAVLDAAGLSMPATPLRALVRVLPLLMLLWWRGLRFRERDASAIGDAALLRIDACAAVYVGLSFSDPLRAVYFEKRFLYAALEAGEPHRVLRALEYEAVLRSMSGRETLSRFEEHIDRTARALVERLGGSSAQRLTEHGASLVLRGRFREARAELERAEEKLGGDAGAQLNERSIGRFYLAQALYYLGAWSELARVQAAFVADARERGDLALEVRLSALTGYVAALMDDRPDAASAELRRVEALWSRSDQFQHYAGMLAHAMIELYRERGAGGGALAVVSSRWQLLERSRLMIVAGVVRCQSLDVRAAALVAAAAASPSERRELLRRADRDARALERLATAPARAYATCIRAGIAATRGDRVRAADLAAEAESRFDALDMTLHAAACRRRRGEIDGDEGRALVESADAIMRDRGIVNPARAAAMFAPGAW